MQRLQSKICVVTGAARGIGHAIATRFQEEGGIVVLTDSDAQAGQAAADALGCRFVALDVREEDDWNRLAREVSVADVVVNNAGVTGFEGGMVAHDPEHASLADWRAVHAVNLDGTFLGCRYAIGAMKAAGTGSIINISSIEGMAGTIACHGYTATKFAVRGLTKSTALELGPFGIRVNSVHPGLVKTPMADWVPEDIFTTALGRIAQPVEVSNLVVYLASDESSYSTGAEFVVDGGTIAGLAHKDFSAVDADAQPDWIT